MAAQYKDVTNGYVFDGQSTLPWAQTFRMTVRVPAIANRVFDTKEHALAFVQDATSTASAIQGLMLTVFADETKGNNGLWYVKSVGEGGQLVQVFDADNGKATVEGDNFVTSTELNSAISELKTAISGNTDSISTLSENVVTEFGNVNTNITNLGTALTEHISTFDTFTGSTNSKIESINTTLESHTSSISSAESRIEVNENNINSLQTTVTNNYNTLDGKITANTSSIEANTASISALQSKFDSIGTLLKLGGTVENLTKFKEWVTKNNEKLANPSTEMGEVPVFEVGHVFIDLATNDEYLISSKSDTAFNYEVLGPVINVDSITEEYINNLFA